MSYSGVPASVPFWSGGERVEHDDYNGDNDFEPENSFYNTYIYCTSYSVLYFEVYM